MARLRESLSAELSASRHDPAAGLVRDVNVLGLRSVKGRTYSAAAVREAAALYEGKKVFFDHRPESGPMAGEARPWIATFGRLRNVRFVEGEGLRADLKYNPRHLYAETFRGWMDTDPDAIGLSHDADCEWRRLADGSAEITRIVRVTSVDLTGTPASTGGLLESEDSMDDLTTGTTTETPAAPDHKEALKGGFMAAISALAQQCLDGTMDEGEACKSIVKHLKAHGKLAGADEGEVTEADDDDPDKKKGDQPEDDMTEAKMCEAVGKLLDAKLKTFTEAVTRHVDLKLADHGTRMTEAIGKAATRNADVTPLSRPPSAPADLMDALRADLDKVPAGR